MMSCQWVLADRGANEKRRRFAGMIARAAGRQQQAGELVGWRGVPSSGWREVARCSE